MRYKNAPALAAALFVVGTSASIAPAASADDAPLSGNWKLVVLPFGDDEFAIFKLMAKEGKTTASVTDAQQMLGSPQVKAVEQQDGLITITLSGSGGSTVFKGRLAKEGPGAGKFLGTLKFRGGNYPARLETTKDSKVAKLSQSPLAAKLHELQSESDIKSKVNKLEEAIRDNHRGPNSSMLYTELLSSAQAAGLKVEKVTELVKRWIDEAKPYGDEWTNDIRLRALRAVASSKSFARLTVELAQEAERIVSDIDVEAKVDVLTLMAQAARESGMAELAEKSEALHAKLDQQLDLEYHKKSSTAFKPSAFAGRKK